MTWLRWEWGVSVGVWVTYSNVNVSGDIGEIGIIWHHADLIGMPPVLGPGLM